MIVRDLGCWWAWSCRTCWNSATGARPSTQQQTEPFGCRRTPSQPTRLKILSGKVFSLFTFPCFNVQRFIFKHGGLDLSWQSRKLWHFQNLSLDDREISIEIKKSQFCFDTTFQSQKSWSRSRSRNMSRHDIFGKSQQIVSISIES